MVEWIEAAWDAPSHVRVITTVRSSGVSQGPYHAGNMALHVGDDPEAVLVNRASLASQLDHTQPLVWMNQTHSVDVISVDGPEQDPLECDACVTRERDLPLCVMTADCLPVVITDEAGAVVAAVHAGWRGLLNGIIQNTVDEMGAPANTLLAWIGPGISQSVYEVDQSVWRAFQGFSSNWEQCFQPASRQGHFLCSLPGLAADWMKDKGMQVYQSNLCTLTDPRFFSYRQQTPTGRMATVVWGASE